MATKRKQGTSGEQLDRVRLAGQQLEAHRGGRLGWIVDFAGEDPARWLPGDVAAHGDRLAAFAFGPIPPFVVETGSRLGPMSSAEVKTLHRDVGAFLRALVSDPRRLIPVKQEGLERCLVRVTDPGIKPAIFAESWGGPLPAMIFHRLADLIVKSDRLLACKQCGRPFLALRKAIFCGSKCAERWHNGIPARADR